MEAHLIQGSEEWLDFRRSRIGASDSAAILGISPYATAYELWLEKSGRRAPQAMNPGMAFGNKMEPEIRKWVEAKHGTWYVPEVVVHPEYDWCMASLDGISADRKMILEIKTCQHMVFQQAQRGLIPDNYLAQAQHQIACVKECEKVHFVFYHQGEYAEVEIIRDDHSIDEMIRLEKLFYEEHMVKDVPPSMSEKDYLDMSYDEDWASLAAEARSFNVEFEEEKKRYKTSTKKWDSLKKRFTECSDDGNCQGQGIRLTRSWSKGSLDTEKMLADGIDVEKYRKAPSSRITLTIQKEREES